jgi:MoaA/NifB/PqqE/SkfB family radical SAM enzyme
MSGGEPFLFPNFVRFCEELTKNHYISINTNFSLPNIKDFVKEINPSKVIGIYAALHILERERLKIQIQDFAKNVVLYQNKGFNIIVYYVLYPPLLNRFSTDFNRLKNMGVKKIAGKTFKGIYNGKLYPDRYTTKERKLITSLKDDYKYNKIYLDGKMFFKGCLCNAGKNFLKIDVDGNTRRCASSSDSLGNLYKGTIKIKEEATPCQTNRTLCVSQCLKYLLNEKRAQQKE